VVCEKYLNSPIIHSSTTKIVQTLSLVHIVKNLRSYHFLWWNNSHTFNIYNKDQSERLNASQGRFQKDLMLTGCLILFCLLCKLVDISAISTLCARWKAITINTFLILFWWRKQKSATRCRLQLYIYRRMIKFRLERGLTHWTEVRNMWLRCVLLLIDRPRNLLPMFLLID